MTTDGSEQGGAEHPPAKKTEGELQQETLQEGLRFLTKALDVAREQTSASLQVALGEQANEVKLAEEESKRISADIDLRKTAVIGGFLVVVVVISIGAFTGTMVEVMGAIAAVVAILATAGGAYVAGKNSSPRNGS